MKRKKNDVKLIITLGYILTLTVLLTGCLNNDNVTEGEVRICAGNDISNLNPLFNDENIHELEELFRTMEGELKGVVYAFKKNDELVSFGRVGIEFVPEEGIDRFRSRFEGSVGINNETVVSTNPVELEEIIENDAELMHLINQIEERGIIERFGFIRGSGDEERWSITFHISGEHVSFIGIFRQDDIRSYFTYVEGARCFNWVKQLEDGWYIRIDTREPCGSP